MELAAYRHRITSTFSIVELRRIPLGLDIVLVGGHWSNRCQKDHQYAVRCDGQAPVGCSHYSLRRRYLEGIAGSEEVDIVVGWVVVLRSGHMIGHMAGWIRMMVVGLVGGRLSRRTVVGCVEERLSRMVVVGCVEERHRHMRAVAGCIVDFGHMIVENLGSSMIARVRG